MKKLIIVAGLIASTLFGTNIIDGKKEFDSKHYKQAYKTFNQVAVDGMVAKYNMGYMHEMGLSVDKNITKALELYASSAKDGYSVAQNALGNAYLKGVGVKPNLKIAIEYYQLAARQKNQNAIKALKLIQKKINKSKATLGYVTVRSNVSNDKVYLDGKYVGATKIVLPITSKKRHIIKVSKKGYETYTFQPVWVKPGQKRTIRAILKKVRS